MMAPFLFEAVRGRLGSWDSSDELAERASLTTIAFRIERAEGY